MAGSWPDDLLTVLQEHLSASPFADSFVAVRSSGTDEDSAAHSFAGMQCWLLPECPGQIGSCVMLCTLL